MSEIAPCERHGGASSQDFRARPVACDSMSVPASICSPRPGRHAPVRPKAPAIRPSPSRSTGISMAATGSMAADRDSASARPVQRRTGTERNAALNDRWNGRRPAVIRTPGELPVPPRIGKVPGRASRRVPAGRGHRRRAILPTSLSPGPDPRKPPRFPGIPAVRTGWFPMPVRGNDATSPGPEGGSRGTAGFRCRRRVSISTSQPVAIRVDLGMEFR